MHHIESHTVCYHVVAVHTTWRALDEWSLALSRLWAPVGSGVVPEEETALLVQHLLRGADDGTDGTRGPTCSPSERRGTRGRKV